MVKKRQLDFQKTKLRVGRLLSRGRNVTNTSFKSEKILIRQNFTVSHPASSERTVEGLNHSNPAGLVKTLNSYNAHLLVDKKKILTDLPKIINRILDFIQDIDHNVRISAINTLQTILTFTSDVQISSYFLLLTKSVSCVMTHSNFEIRQDSLQLFDAILQTHPTLMWQHKVFLDHLLGMISRVDSSQSMDTRKLRRTIEDSFSENIKAQDWRIQVLSRINNFLMIILKNLLTDETKADDEQEIHWNDKQSLFVPIYLGGGLKPVDVESSRQWNSKFSHVYWKTDIVKSFLSDLLPVLSGVLTEEIAQFLRCSSKESLVSSSTIKNLDILFQVLYHLGKWIKSVSNSQNQLALWFTTMYYNNISNKVMKRFPFVQKIEKEPVGEETRKRGRPRKASHLPSFQLNLKICYLYSTFILGSLHSSMSTEKKVLPYLESVFTLNYKECFSCIPLLIEIAKNYLCLSSHEDIKSSVLKGMCEKLNNQDPCPQQKQLQDFFVELSLSPEYKDLSKISAMDCWYTLLFSQLKEMKKTGEVNIKLLKDVRKISCRRYSDFIEFLQSIKPEEYLDLLTFENEDFQETVVHLIYHTKDLSPDFLQDIAETILLDNFLSFRTAARIIRLLAYKFSGSDITNASQVSCLKFLLNIACDTISIEETKCSDERIVQCMLEKWKSFANVSTFEILPSKLWEKHCKLYEVCVESLQLFHEPMKSLSISKFLQSVLANRYRIPVHSVIAIAKLKNSFSTSSYINQEKALNKPMSELMFSSLLYTSLISTNAEDWQSYGIPEMHSVFNLNRHTVFKVINQMNNVLHICNSDSAFHVLRICGFLISNKYLVPDDLMKVQSLLKKIEVFCFSSVHFHEYFGHVAHYFEYFYEHP